MISIKYNNEFEIVSNGIINLGKFGEFLEDKIEISTEYNRFDIERMNQNERNIIIADLNKKCNGFLERVEKNIESIENEFIICFFRYLIDMNFDFGSYEDISFLNKSSLNSEKDIEDIYSKLSEENYKQIYSILDNTKQKNLNGKHLFSEYLPLIDIDKILESITPYFLEVNEDFIRFEINSNYCDGELISAMVIEVDNELGVEIIDY